MQILNFRGNAGAGTGAVVGAVIEGLTLGVGAGDSAIAFVGLCRCQQ